MMFNHSRVRLALCALIVGMTGLAAIAADVYSVDYRRTKWKTIHFKDSKKAEVHYKTVKSLGCEAKKHAHGDHIDVTYRCLKWRRINLKNHDLAHRWEKWLKSSGFETKHEH